LALTALVAFPGAFAAGEGGGDPTDAGFAAPPAASDAGAAAPSAGPDAGGRSRQQQQQQRRYWRRHGGPDARPAGDGGVADGGVMLPMLARPAMIRPRPPVPVPTPPPPPSRPLGPAPVTPPAALAALGEFNTCKKIPPGKKVVKLNLKPDAELADLIAWISTITCKSFVLPGHLTAQGKKITIVAPNIMTREEAFAAFLNALDSIGLTVERASGYLRIIETSKAKTSVTPVYGFDGNPAPSGSSE
jgi:hypothetical protein